MSVILFFINKGLFYRISSDLWVDELGDRKLKVFFFPYVLVLSGFIHHLSLQLRTDGFSFVLRDSSSA